MQLWSSGDAGTPRSALQDFGMRHLETKIKLLFIMQELYCLQKEIIFDTILQLTVRVSFLLNQFLPIFHIRVLKKYNFVNGRYEPEIVQIPCDLELFKAMKRDLLIFTEEFAKTKFCDIEMLEQGLFNFVLTAQKNSVKYPVIVSVLSRLYDSVEMFGKKHEYAPLVSYEQIEAVRDGALRNQFTNNMNMSFARLGADQKAKELLMDLYQFTEEDDFNGGKKLTPAEYKRKKSYETQYENIKALHSQFVYKYNTLIETVDVSDKIVFVTEEVNVKQPEFVKLMDLLDEQKEKNITYRAISLNGLTVGNMDQAVRELGGSPVDYHCAACKDFRTVSVQTGVKIDCSGLFGVPLFKNRLLQELLC